MTRFERGHAKIDLLAPEGIGANAETIPPGYAIQAPGTTQASHCLASKHPHIDDHIAVVSDSRRFDARKSCMDRDHLPADNRPAVHRDESGELCDCFPGRRAGGGQTSEVGDWQVARWLGVADARARSASDAERSSRSSTMSTIDTIIGA